MEDTLVFYVNGQKVTVTRPDPELTLLTYLRDHLNLKGTKYGCGEGGCGACTVLVTKIVNDVPKHMTVNSCLAPLCSMHAAVITTVEGVGSVRTQLHPVQKVMATSHGSQCGYCTPGFIMSMYTLLCNNPRPRVRDIEESFQGNLCRCTGYRPIVQGFTSTFATDVSYHGKEDDGSSNSSSSCSGSNNKKKDASNELSGSNDENDDKCDELSNGSEDKQETSVLDSQFLCFKSKHVSWYRPTKLSDLLQLKAKHPEAKLVIGNTEIGIETRYKNMEYPVIISCTHINHAATGEENDDNRKIWIGASVTLDTLEKLLDEKINSLPGERTRLFVEMMKMLKLFAGPQIKNVASIGGNLMTASPISDLVPILVSARSEMVIASTDGTRRRVLDGKFFTGYRKLSMQPDEILLKVSLPYSNQMEYYSSFKMSRRRDDDISIVNASMYVKFKSQIKNCVTDNDDKKVCFVVDDVIIAYGGMSTTVVVANNTMNLLKGKEWNDDLLNMAISSLSEETSLNLGVPGGMEAYRSSLTLSFFFKFYVDVCLQLQKDHVKYNNEFDKPILPPSLTSHEDINMAPKFKDELSVVGKPILHESAFKHATGEAAYVDDLPHYKDELFLSFVLSSKAHANILNVDYSEALKCDGVVGVVGPDDVPGSNWYGKLIKDEEVFCSKTVVAQYQPILGVLAQTKSQSRKAVQKVKVEYEELTPILSIKEAMANNSLIKPLPPLKNGDPLTVMEACEFVLEDEVSMGGQEHFYMETNGCVVVPHEDGGAEIWSSTQHCDDVQRGAASVMGVSTSKILVRVGRVGGGFGGKENKPQIPALPAVVAAHKFKRPVRCTLDRDDDMLMTGGRHPYYAKYKVGFTKEGHIEALVVEMFANCGCFSDCSEAVIEKATFQLDNMYHFKHILIKRFLCKTNLPSNTAFRGFGTPQATFVCETILDHVASHLKLSTVSIRELNMYNAGDQTMYNQIMDCDVTLKNCWQQTKERSDFEKQLEEIEEFNRSHRWMKRGLSLNGIKYGVGYSLAWLHQAGALVNVFKDGSVLLSHGGTEMGQGLHTKMIQVAAEVLQISTSMIHIHETNSHIIPNASPTAASSSSDLFGMAIVLACEKIIRRLQPYIKSKPESGWKAWIERAYMDRVQLMATGYYKKAFSEFDVEKNKGLMYHYFTLGVACSVVQIDCLTGALQLLRTDIVMDVGKSLNPAIDVGQIEGAYMQGFGLYTMEDLKYSCDGRLLMNGPGVYKIPSVCDTPRIFNVTLLKNSKNLKAVYSSKAIGEPPLLLAISVVGAIRQAITSARKDAGLSDNWFRLDSPLTCERIRMACTDQFTNMYKKKEAENYKPWFKDIV
ncbi:hypothetical protein HELRODRAFT_110470 [Helobdella robusta]|uniref:xanthine dehydrogenase n=1 Tax=Helobdella robusta TaxID=6412 RepID=T1EF24_HELRO|nr:hypothetical protein HELRODRAFT_110470 [Helobdella robusta]ESO07509.1 hypothetical protein HELRODRAFT_110470 [Helobdella robusta]